MQASRRYRIGYNGGYVLKNVITLFFLSFFFFKYVIIPTYVSKDNVIVGFKSGLRRNPGLNTFYRCYFFFFISSRRLLLFSEISAY